MTGCSRARGAPCPPAVWFLCQAYGLPARALLPSPAPEPCCCPVLFLFGCSVPQLLSHLRCRKSRYFFCSFLLFTRLISPPQDRATPGERVLYSKTTLNSSDQSSFEPKPTDSGPLTRACPRRSSAREPCRTCRAAARALASGSRNSVCGLRAHLASLPGKNTTH